MAAPDSDPSIFKEPHMQGESGGEVRCARCGYSQRGLAADRCPECGRPAFEPASALDAVDHSVWDEPTLHRQLTGDTPHDAVTYQSWLAAGRARTTAIDSWGAVAGLALAAGPFAVLGAFWGAGESTLSVLALVLIGPVIEEVMKVAAASWAVERRPHWFRNGWQIALCCAFGGLVFAAIENVLYLRVYVPDPPSWLVWWRWTVCVALHSGCSLIAGLGLMRVWRTAMREQRRPDLTAGYRFMLIAIALHAFYNTMAVVFELGVRAGK